MRADGIPIKSLLWRTFTPAIVILAVVLGALVYNRLYDTILDGFSRKLIATSALTGALIDPADHDFLIRAAQVRAPAESVEAMPQYLRNVEPMRQIRKDLGLTYLYSQVLGGTKDVIYVLDSTVGEEHSNIGAEDELTAETRIGLGRTTRDGTPYVSPIEFQEQWGLLKTAAAPIRSRTGKIVATAGADVNISVIEVATQNALFASALIGVASLIASAIVTWLIVRWVALPIEGLKADALRIAAGDRAPPTQTASPREVSRLRGALADLAVHLVASMRSAWTDTLGRDRARNVELLSGVLGAAGPVTLVEGVVWEASDDGLEARLERRAMTLLAERFAADTTLAKAWRDLVRPVHGTVRETAA
ncbi:MAG: histidine kinase [Alphaproteobacteria bacterium]|nr:histidine kinase [Alphaproteobacteria bacterium]MBU1516050.1 histidine kinase [Alphaproteobacteria bacterium]MBU2092735.1 histidine kinase [Alphaproteobacteria bacterium]MBU2153740.1 histidine kinase [Alphaproteobacteria bacterium]MBU2308368.1 histidine kinase [Alphaproteobacteria bacterium]